MNNLSSYCGLVDARISAYEKDLRKTPLIGAHQGFIGLHTLLQKNLLQFATVISPGM